MKNNIKRITIDIPNDLQKWVKMKAIEEDTTLRQIIIRSILHYKRKVDSEISTDSSDDDRSNRGK